MNCRRKFTNAEMTKTNQESLQSLHNSLGDVSFKLKETEIMREELDKNLKGPEKKLRELAESIATNEAQLED